MVGVSLTQARLLLNSHFHIGDEVWTNRRMKLILTFCSIYYELQVQHHFTWLSVVYGSLYPFHNGLKNSTIKRGKSAFISHSAMVTSKVADSEGNCPLVRDVTGTSGLVHWLQLRFGRDANKLIHAAFQRDAMKMLRVEGWWVFMVLHLRSNSAQYITVGVEFEEDAEVKDIKIF